MKKITLSLIALSAFVITASAQSGTNKSTSTQRPSTQQIGQSGSNGTGEGIKYNSLNGTGDGLANQDKRTYSQQLEAKGLLPSKPGAHNSQTHEAHPATTTDVHGRAPSEADAEIKPKH